MEEKNSEELLHQLYEQVNEHIETRVEYFTLNATEKMSSIAAGLAGAFTVFLFAVIVLFFFSMGFAWWIGDYIENRAGGFALAGLIFIPVAALVYRWVRPFVRDKVIQTMLPNEPTEQATEDHG